jgi:hypothetical protein
MAAFDPTETLGRFDFFLLRDGPVILYYDHGDLEKACEWLRKHTYTLYHFNCQHSLLSRWGCLFL